MMDSLEEHVPTAAETASLWTDEKHVQFLNSIEASFVTAMLENGSGSIHRLRRHLLDASESTSNLNPHRTASVNHAVSGGRSRMRGRRRSFKASNSCQDEDQVVPQIGSGQDDNSDGSEQASTV